MIRQFIQVACVASLALTPTVASAQAQLTPEAAAEIVRPIIARIRQDEAAIAAAAKEGDAERLQMISWRNTEAAREIYRVVPRSMSVKAVGGGFQPCVQAQDLLGFLAGILVDAAASNAGGESQRTDNDVRRQSLNFHIGFFHKDRNACALEAKADLAASPLGNNATEILPPFRIVHPAPLSNADKTSLKQNLVQAATVEHAIQSVIRGGNHLLLEQHLSAAMRMEREMFVRRFENASGHDAAIAKACHWQGMHLRSLFNEAYLFGSRRDAVDKIDLNNLRMTLDQYRRTKSDCAAVLVAPKELGQVHIEIE